MSYEEIKNEVLATEILSAADRKVAQLLGNLRTVEAPKNFDLRLKARIANAAANDRKPLWLSPVFRYAVPMSLVLLIGAIFFLNDTYTVDNESVPSVADVSTPSDPTGNFSQIPPTVVGDKTLPVNLATPRIEELVAESKDKSINEKRNTPSKRTGGGSADKAQGVKNIILPRGLNPQVAPEEKPKGFDNAGRFTAREILSTIGIDAEFDGNAWKVKSVTKDSPAERAGIRSADIVEAVDDRVIGESTVFTGSFSGKTLKVLRDNKKLEINLQNK